jgi:hypothetical protein
MLEEVTTKRDIIVPLNERKSLKVKHLGSTLTYRNSIQEEIKSRLKSGNACYYSMQNILSSSLLHKDIKIETHRNIILSVVLYGC